MKQYKLVHGDCLDIMKRIPDKSIDLILCDLPYGTTSCKWDSVIAFDDLWFQYERIAKTKAPIVLFAAQPFTTALIHSNMERFKYSLIWEKNRPSGVAQSKNRPISCHEDICVFSKGVVIHEGQSKKRMNYYPQGLIKCNVTKKNSKHSHQKAGGVAQRPSHKDTYKQEFTNYPKSVLKFDCEPKPVHPTQKPINLMSYLVKTYSLEGDLVLDNTMGSGTTGMAAVVNNRRFFGIEKEFEYYKIAERRIKSLPRRLF